MFDLSLIDKFSICAFWAGCFILGLQWNKRVDE
jgi:hypothetical protein